LTKPSKKYVEQLAKDSYNKAENEYLRISFEHLDWDRKEFFVHGCTETYYHHLFDVFCELKKSTANQIKQRQVARLNPKPIVWHKESTITQSSFPSKIKESLKPQTDGSAEDQQKQFEDMTKDAFELMVAKSYGRIHGFIHDNIFYVVWFDPAHNLFLGRDRGDGKIGKIVYADDYKKMSLFCPEKINGLKDLNETLYKENLKLKKENKDLLDMLDEKTTPN